MRTATLGLTTLALAIAGLSCGGDGGTGPRIPADIVITPNNPFVGQGQTVQLSAKVVDNNGAQIQGLGVIWSLSDSTVATISANGLVGSTGPLDTIVVTAEHQGITRVVNLIVTQRVVGLTVAEPSLSLHRNTSRGLTVTAVDFVGAPVPVSGLVFGTSAPAIATVSAAGIVTAQNITGLATITVSKDALSAQVPVTVRIATTVVQTLPSTVLLSPGGLDTIGVTVLDSLFAPIAGATVTFTSANPAIATVSAAGIVTSPGPPGTTSITVHSDTVQTLVRVFVGSDLQGVRVSSDTFAGTHYGIAIAGNGTVFAGDVSGTTVARAGTSNFSFTHFATVSPTPLGMTASPDGTILFVGNASNSNIERFNTGTAAQLASFPVPNGVVYSLAITPDGSTLVAGSNSWVWILNASTGAILDSFPATDAIHVAVHPTGPLAYGSMYSGGKVVEFNWVTDASRDFPVNGTAQGVTVTPDGLQLYATTEGPDVIRGWTIATGASLPDINTGGPGFGLAATNTKLVVAQTTGRIEVYDLATHTLVNGIVVGGLPRRVAVSADAKSAAVSNESGWVDLIQ